MLLANAYNVLLAYFSCEDLWSKSGGRQGFSVLSIGSGEAAAPTIKQEPARRFVAGTPQCTEYFAGCVDVCHYLYILADLTSTSSPVQHHQCARWLNALDGSMRERQSSTSDSISLVML